MSERIKVAMAVQLLFGILVDLLLAFYAATFIANGKTSSHQFNCPQTNSQQFNYPQTASQQFNCRNMHTIQLKDMLGQGTYKVVYLGVYANHTKVVVKFPKRPKDCLLKNSNSQHCLDQSRMKLIKEIHASQQLKHPNILPMLGYCHKSRKIGATSFHQEGLISVYEYGSSVNRRTLEMFPTLWRLNTMIELLDLLIYLENSPMGSIQIRDMRTKHFVLKGNKLMLIDLEGLEAGEPLCGAPKPRNLNIPSVDRGTGIITPKECKSLNLSCTGGHCVGFNAVNALQKLNYYVLMFMLSIPEDDKDKLGPQNTRIIKETFARANAMLKKPHIYSATVLRHLLLKCRDELK